MSKDSAQALTLAELPDLRHKTEAVSQFLRQQIAAHLETLRPLFAPERVLGKSAGGKVDVQGSERALSELQQSYRNFTRKPYDLPETFDTNWLTLVGNALELHPWEYAYQVQGKPVSISSPVRWVVNYRRYPTSGSRTAISSSLDSQVHPRQTRPGLSAEDQAHRSKIFHPPRQARAIIISAGRIGRPFIWHRQRAPSQRAL